MPQNTRVTLLQRQAAGYPDRVRAYLEQIAGVPPLPDAPAGEITDIRRENSRMRSELSAYRAALRSADAMGRQLFDEIRQCRNRITYLEVHETISPAGLESLKLSGIQCDQLMLLLEGHLLRCRTQMDTITTLIQAIMTADRQQNQALILSFKNLLAQDQALRNPNAQEVISIEKT